MLRLPVVIASLAACALVAAPLVGVPAVTRLPAIVVPAILLSAIAVRPWQWDRATWQRIDEWQPSRRVMLSGAVAIGLVLYWFVLTRFQSASINAVDFTVYFDRPCFQTISGRPLFVETANVPSFSHRSQLAVHASWIMFPVCGLYLIAASPQWLLLLSVVAIVAGAIHVMRIARHVGANGVLACGAAVAFALNDNTARTLNYGFHPEVLYAWFIPWLLDAGLRRARLSFLAAAVACVLVKEDAAMPLFAAAITLALLRWHDMTATDRLFFLLLPTALALVNLALYYRVVVPMFLPDGRPTYAAFWVNYGATPIEAGKGMLLQPARVIGDALTSGFFTTVLPPHLFLPLVGWRWLVGSLPIVLVYGASANEQLRAFGLYYAIVLVPFLVLGSAFGASKVARRFARIAYPQTIAGAIIVLGALVVGSTRAGYSLRPWRPEIPAVKQALGELSSEPIVLVQSSLYPHAGYSSRIQLLTPDALEDPRNTNAVAILAPELGAYPFSRDRITALAACTADRRVGGLLVIVRIAPRMCGDGSGVASPRSVR